MVRLCLLTAILFLSSLSALAAQCVRFDVAHSIAAQDVTTPEFLAMYPHEKLVQIRLPISSLLQSEESRLEFLYMISGTTTHPFQVVDYAPKTTLITDIEGLVSSEVSEDNSTSIGLHALSPDEFPVKTDANAKLSRGSRQLERMDRLPPKQLLSASGTMHRGLSAYFKLKPSTQTTLEGGHVFEVTARVKQGWRASLIHVHCTAFLTDDESARVASKCSQQGFVVGVYLAGDDMAKSSVEKLAIAQLELLKLAQVHARSIEDRRFPSIGHKLGAALSVVKPKIPESWLNDLLTSGDFHRFERHLPRPVRDAATEYRQARAKVIGFAG